MNETNLLQQYFPLIRKREEFLAFCSGAIGMKMLYDGVFKENFNPEVHPERLESLLAEVLGRSVRIKAVLPNDGPRLGIESALIYTDIIVELEDGSFANVEIQKIGLAFPGERSACYSADHLLRQYKKLRNQLGKQFTYKHKKSVYTIVFFERSAKEMHAFEETWIHHFSQKSDSGLEMNLLQEYYFVSLDIFKKSMENKGIQTKLEAWLSFLSFDEPERIIDLINIYPEFKDMYQEIYRLCLNTEKVLEVCSMELRELDRNTVLYMMDEMQEQIEELGVTLAQKSEALAQKDAELELRDQRIRELEALLLEKNRQQI